ncbi:UxaA family hydrolase [Fusibacter paucivorans]|uniref:UxaA family hydrolase n=1 Tax=Fusibacter paucivorans TaxID=76009 RepID=A0ABS5PLY7_9FIRM|nr:UxaA family hydrolase [Fusibacter paucivorans]MBS7525942.1 UxaA family hydrolase [Fusibacter paucivorans]
MKTNTVLLNQRDNVVTATQDIAAGEAVIFFFDNKLKSINAIEAIPAWNKVAIEDIAEQSPIVKYGEIIGASLQKITKGAYVSHLNIESLPRDYDKEMR